MIHIGYLPLKDIYRYRKRTHAGAIGLLSQYLQG